MGRETVDFERELNTQCGAGGYFGNVNVNAIPVNRCMESNRMKLFKASDFMMRGSDLTLGDGKYFEVNSSNFNSFLFNFIFTYNFSFDFFITNFQPLFRFIESGKKEKAHSNIISYIYSQFNNAYTQPSHTIQQS